MSTRLVRPVPLRRVVPWWLVAAAVVSLAVIVVVQQGHTAVGAFWGPCIGLVIRDRLDDAAKRSEEGRDTSRASLVGRAWVEPVVGVLLGTFVVGLSMLAAAVFDGVSAARLGTGVALCTGGALGCAVLVLVGHRRLRRREAEAAEAAEATDATDDGTAEAADTAVTTEAAADGTAAEPRAGEPRADEPRP
ncbi:hypothetical protein [Frigoribacterium faeni]|uniref:hypothetical protein n=1 Tax=Frigoribacterium faeni TaxID=145483 RepID=UPI00141A8ED1|nr:hypothetical protein [Frigoribacterium faeni]NIJ04622.1 hypothetical protein [Frigoribacterium faeni]